MKLLLAFAGVSVTALSFAATNDYTVTVRKPDWVVILSRPEYQASTNLVGKSITAIFGPISEVRVEIGSANKTAIDEDAKKVEQEIRKRIHRARCLGRDSEVSWSKAPWVQGHILLKDGRILPIQILLSGVIIADLLFSEEVEPSGAANGASPRR